MRKQSLFMILISFAAVAALLTGCAGTQKASESNFKTPEVTLSHAEVPSYFGYWFYDNKVQPTQPANAKPGNNGAPLIYAFILNIKNPNDFPVLMDNLRFTVALEGFDLSTVNSQEQTWVPAGKTSSVEGALCAGYGRGIRRPHVGGRFHAERKESEGLGPASKNGGPRRRISPSRWR